MNPHIASVTSFIGMTLVAVIFTIGGLVVLKSYRKSQNITLKYFSIFLLSYGVMHILYAFAAFLTLFFYDLRGWVWSYPIANIFMYAANVYFIRIPFAMIMPKLEKFAFYALFLLAAIGEIVILFNRPFIADSGILVSPNGLWFNVPTLSAIAVMGHTTITMLIAVVLFIWTAVKVKEKIFKIRAVLFALGIAIFLIGGPMHNITGTLFLAMLADIIVASSNIFILSGIYITKFKKE